MDNQQKKDYLSRYQAMMREVEDARSQLLELNELEGYARPLLSGQSGGGCNPHRLEEAVECLEAARERLAGKIARAIAVRTEIEQIIETVTDARYKQLLVRRYLLGQTWLKVAENMYMDERWVRRLHEKALAQLEIPQQLPAM